MTRRIPSCDDVRETFGVEAKVAAKTPRPEAVLKWRDGGRGQVLGGLPDQGENWDSYSKGSGGLCKV